MDTNTAPTQAMALPTQQLAQRQPNTQGLDAKQVGKEFESLFIHQMLELMSQGVKTPEVMGGGSAEGIFRSMMNEKIAAEVANAGGLGVAEAIENQVKRYQEAQNR